MGQEHWESALYHLTRNSLSADGRMALSNNYDSPIDKLYAQPLKANGTADGTPDVVASDPIISVDVSTDLSGHRYVIYMTDEGGTTHMYLQRIDSATGMKMGSRILLN